MAGVKKYLADPAKKENLVFKIKECWNNRIEYRKFLEKRIPDVKTEARSNFLLLNNI